MSRFVRELTDGEIHRAEQAWIRPFSTSLTAMWTVSLVAVSLAGNARAQPITEFVIPPPSSGPQSITSGPDGNLWFTLWGYTNAIGRITPSGVVEEFPIPRTIRVRRVSPRARTATSGSPNTSATRSAGSRPPGS